MEHAFQKDDEATLKRSIRIRKSTIPNDYIVYLKESDYNIGAENDSKTFSQGVSCSESISWCNAMKDEMNSVVSNEI